jgi:chromate transporter
MASTGPVRQDNSPSPDHGIGFGEAARVWLRIALLSFGGPAGQIALMHRILVEEKKWIGEERFLHALNFCMLLPGPEAQQLATYIGWLLHKVRGGLLAGTLFILPGLVAIMALSWIYVLWGGAGPVTALFFGLKAAVLAIIFEAVVRIGRRALRGRARIALAVAAFLALFLLGLPFPLLIAIAAAIGLAAGRLGSTAFSGGGGHGAAGAEVPDAETALGTELPAHARPGATRMLPVITAIAFLWLAPVAVLAASGGGTFADIAGFFSKMAVVTFGGAYAVLAYVAQAAVESYGWLKPGEMLDGLGLAETTPGPLIMVTQFVGFLGAYRNPEGLPPLVAGTLGGLLTTWVTFLPCFLWIFAGAPFVERLRENRLVASSLSAITAAVVGVILNLAIWFGIHFLFRSVQPVPFAGGTLELPLWSSIDPWAAILSAAALLAIVRFKANVPTVIAACGLAGMVVQLLR